MNVLAGSLYGTPIAVPFIAVASTVGSSGSFWLSKLLLKVSQSQAVFLLLLRCLHRWYSLSIYELHGLAHVMPLHARQPHRKCEQNIYVEVCDCRI